MARTDQDRPQLTRRDELRREHLARTCRAIAGYIEAGHTVRLRTVMDDESVAELREYLRGKAATVFVIEDWEAFRELLEPHRDRDANA